MYLWRKDMMQDYNQQVEYMRSPEWDEIYSEKIRRWATLCHTNSTSSSQLVLKLTTSAAPASIVDGIPNKSVRR